MEEDPFENQYHLEFIVVNINKSVKRTSNKMNYSKDLLVKLTMHSGTTFFIKNKMLLPSHQKWLEQKPFRILSNVLMPISVLSLVEVKRKIHGNCIFMVAKVQF